MSELKSAWEVAQERANRLGNLSAQEKEQQERQGYGRIGQALAQKWMDGSQRLDMTAELSRHEEKGREIVKKAVIERLVEAIELTTTQGRKSVRRAVEGISSLRPELQPRAEEMAQLSNVRAELRQLASLKFPNCYFFMISLKMTSFWTSWVPSPRDEPQASIGYLCTG